LTIEFKRTGFFVSADKRHTISAWKRLVQGIPRQFPSVADKERAEALGRLLNSLLTFDVVIIIIL
jgi:hypothetical protein